MTNQAISFKPDCGLALWYLLETDRDTYINHLVRNHELRLITAKEGVGKSKYISYIDEIRGFGTAPLVTPQLKKHVGMILGKASIELNGYHTIPKGYLVDTKGYITVSLGDYYNDR